MKTEAVLEKHWKHLRTFRHQSIFGSRAPRLSLRPSSSSLRPGNGTWFKKEPITTSKLQGIDKLLVVEVPTHFWKVPTHFWSSWVPHSCCGYQSWVVCDVSDRCVCALLRILANQEYQTPLFPCQSSFDLIDMNIQICPCKDVLELKNITLQPWRCEVPLGFNTSKLQACHSECSLEFKNMKHRVVLFWR